MSLTDEDKRWITEQMRQEIREENRQIYDRIERVETTLLTEFHKWASPLDARIRTHTAALRALDLETEAIDDRLKKLEGQKPQ
jgi:hypothetical protein